MPSRRDGPYGRPSSCARAANTAGRELGCSPSNPNLLAPLSRPPFLPQAETLAGQSRGGFFPRGSWHHPVMHSSAPGCCIPSIPRPHVPSAVLGSPNSSVQLSAAHWDPLTSATAPEGGRDTQAGHPELVPLPSQLPLQPEQLAKPPRNPLKTQTLPVYMPQAKTQDAAPTPPLLPPPRVGKI